MVGVGVTNDMAIMTVVLMVVLIAKKVMNVHEIHNNHVDTLVQRVHHAVAAAVPLF